jgi:chromosome partitioning protein
MKTLTFYNMKGGVGKTTAVVNFAYLAAQEGNYTLLWDLDPQRAATFHFRMNPESGIKSKHLQKDKEDIGRLIKATDYQYLDLIPANLKLRHINAVLRNIENGTKILSKVIQQLASRYDYVFFDCPTGISVLTESLFRIADYLVIPVIPTTLALQTFNQIRLYLSKHVQEEPQIIPFFSMVDQRKSLHHQIIETSGSEGLFCKASIPTRSIIEQMGLHRAPLPYFNPDSKATLEYKALWEEIKTRIL